MKWSKESRKLAVEKINENVVEKKKWKKLIKVENVLQKMGKKSGQKIYFSTNLKISKFYD